VTSRWTAARIGLSESVRVLEAAGARGVEVGDLLERQAGGAGKVRRVYLRIIHGPEYTLPENLQRLWERGLSGKRSLARGHALGDRTTKKAAGAGGLGT